MKGVYHLGLRRIERKSLTLNFDNPVRLQNTVQNDWVLYLFGRIALAPIAGTVIPKRCRAHRFHLQGKRLTAERIMHGNRSVPFNQIAGDICGKPPADVDDPYNGYDSYSNETYREQKAAHKFETPREVK